MIKKIVKISILCVFLLPFVVGAKEHCKVVSGNGKDIGSEIACGSEHFYVIDSNKDEIKMFAKYNLNVGKTIYKEKIEKEPGDTRTDNEYCQDLATSKNGEVKSDGFYNAPGYCFYVTNTIDYIDSEKTPIVQSEAAKSAHWDEDLNYLYPQVGDVYIYPGTSSDGVKHYQLHENPVQENTNFYDYDMTYGGPYSILQIYKNELEISNYTITEINMLSVSELDRIINKISQKSLPLKEWGDNLEIVQGQYENNGIIYGTEIHFGDLKPYIPNDYKWLYSTTYWNSTAYKLPSNPSIAVPKNYYVFTAEQGKLCGAGFALCAPETAIGCGVRPVITIPNELQYLIKTKTDGNGSIEVIDSSLGGEEIKFKITTNTGYKLDKLIITTDSGEKVEFDDGEIIKNADGTISIDKNKFTMPFDNVTIEAKWVLDIINPKTGSACMVIILVIVSLVLSMIYMRRCKRV